MLRKYLTVMFTVLAGVSTGWCADQITLKNGDHLTGTITKFDGSSVILHTDAAGDVTIDVKSITQMTTDEDQRVATADKRVLVGKVTTSGDNFVVATKSGNVEVPKDKVTAMVPEEGYEKTAHPGLRHGWQGGANVGFSLARGNSDTENLALAFNAVHPTINSKITLYATSVNTTNNLATPSTVANLVTGGFRYDHDLNPKLFAFGAADFMSNALQFLDLRQVYTGGLGFHAIKNSKTVLDILGGVNYTHETYSNGPEVIPVTVPPTFVSYGVTNRFVALTLGEELTQKLGKSTGLMEKFYFYPDLSNTGQYRTVFNLGTVTKISKWLGWQNEFDDIYVSNPPAATKKNDVIFTTGLNIAFTH